MARKKHSAKQIVALLRQIDVEFGWLHGSWPKTGSEEFEARTTFGTMTIPRTGLRDNVVGVRAKT